MHSSQSFKFSITLSIQPLLRLLFTRFVFLAVVLEFCCCCHCCCCCFLGWLVIFIALFLLKVLLLYLHYCSEQLMSTEISHSQLCQNCMHWNCFNLTENTVISKCQNGWFLRYSLSSVEMISHYIFSRVKDIKRASFWYIMSLH